MTAQTDAPAQRSDRARLRSADRLGAILTTAPKWIALAVVVWQAGLSIQVLARPGAGASLLLRFNRQTTAWELVCWLAGFAGVLYGLYSRLVLARLRTLPERDRGRRSSL